MQMAALSVALKGATLTTAQRAIAVLRKFGTNAHVYLPGTGTLNGLTASNYLDSVVGPLVAVDEVVGRVNDATGGLGPELVTNGGFDSGTGWTAEGGWNISGGVATNTTGSGGLFTGISGFTTGKTYVVQYTITGNGAVAAYVRGGAVGTLPTTAGSFTAYLVAGASATRGIEFYTAIGRTLDNISVREVTGIHATQATTASKPTVRKGAVNLLTYSQDFSNAAWAVGGGATKVDASTFSAAAQFGTLTSIGAVGTSVVGTTYTFSVILSGTGTVRLLVQDYGGAFPSNQSGNITLTATPTRYSLTRTHTDAVATRMACQIFNQGVTAATITSGGAQLETGSTASTYAPTTTAAASNKVGNTYWRFDGTNDTLTLGAPLFQMADDHCVIAGAIPVTATTDCDVFGQRNTAATNALCPLLRFGADGKVKALYRDDAGLIDGPVMAASYVAGAPYVATARKIGNVKLVRTNGVAGSTVNTALGTTTLNTSTIGAGLTTGLLGMFNGSIYPVIAIKGTVSDADLLILEKWVGTLTGPTGVQI